MAELLPRRARDGRAHNTPLLLWFVASALVHEAVAASSLQSASPAGSSEFYETLDVDTLDDSDEVIGSDGTLRETSADADIHDILELIEDGRLYPVLSKDDIQYAPSTSTSNNIGEYSPANVLKKDATTLFLDDFEQSEKKRRKRNDEVFTQDDRVKSMPIFTDKPTTKNKTFSQSKNIQGPSNTSPNNMKVNFNNFIIKCNFTTPSSHRDIESSEPASTKGNDTPLKEELRYRRDVTSPGANKTTKEPSGRAKEKRVKTGDTILNIQGAVRDSIGDAVASGTEGASLLDAVVIHPAQYLRDSLAAANFTDRTPTETGSVRTAGAGARAAGAVERPAGERQLLAEHRARVRLDCDLPANISVAEWIKDGEVQNVGPGAAAGTAVWWAEGSGGAAVVGRAGRGEAGAWRCAGYDRNGDKLLGQPLILTVYEESRPPYLELDGRRLDPGNTWVPVEQGALLEVRCVAEGGVPAPELTWRLVGAPEGPGGRADRPRGSPHELRRLMRASPADYSRAGVASSAVRVAVESVLHNASLECDATQPRPEPRHPRTATARLLVHVTYPPSFVISRYPGFGVALWTGGLAALRCDVDSNPRVRAWWVREGGEVVPSSAPVHSDAPPPDAEPHSATLTWPSLALAHAGWYRCRAKWNGQEYSSIGYYLIVRPSSDRPPSSSEPPPPAAQQVAVPLGGSVQVHCPKGSVGCWARRLFGGNSSEAWAPAGSARAHGVLGIRGALHQEGGEYRCVGARAEDALRMQELKRITLTVNGSPTATAVDSAPLSGGGRRLSCVACGRSVRVRWVLLAHGGGGGGGGEGGVLAPGDSTTRARAAPLEPDPLAPACAHATLDLADDGEVWCAAAGEGGGAVAVFPTPTSAPPHQPPRALAAAAAPALAPAAPRRAAPLLALLLLLARCNVT